MSTQFAKLTDTGSDWAMPVVERGAPKRFADSSISALSLQRMDPVTRYQQYGLAEVVTKNFDGRYYNATYTEDLVGTQVIGTPTTALKADDRLLELRLADIKAYRDGIIASPIVFTVDGVEHPMSMSLTSQFRTANAAARGVDEVWRFHDGDFVSVTAVQLAAMETAIASHIRACFVAQATHIAAVSALTGQAIIDYDITTDWPAVYEVQRGEL